MNNNFTFYIYIKVIRNKKDQSYKKENETNLSYKNK